MANFVPKAPTDPLFKAENISFLNRKGDVVASTYNAAGKSWAIELPAGTAGEDELFAYFRGSTSVSVGKLSINRFIEQPKKLQIVLLRGAAALDNADLQTQLNKIYAPALLKWQVVQQSLNCDFDLNADGKAGLDVGNNAALSNYTAEMKALLGAYFGGSQVKDPQTTYLFVTPSFSNNSVQGYMPRGKNVGFVSNVGAIAHELGHGAFGLEHTFDKNPASKNNLMDYGGGSFLTQAQWKKIQNPGVIINWFDDAEDAMFFNFLVGGIIGGFADGVSQFAINFIDDYDDNKSITDISAAAARKISVPQVLIAVGAGAISSGLSSEASVAKFATRLASNVKVQAAIITGIEAGLDFIIGVTGDQVNNYFKDKTSKQTGQQIVIDNLLSSSLFTAGSAMMKTKLGKNVKGWLLKKLGNVFRPLLDDAGELTVGDYGDLKKIYNAGTKGNGLTAHHIPSDAYMKKLVEGGTLRPTEYNTDDGICVVVESVADVTNKIKRHNRTKTFWSNMSKVEKDTYFALDPRKALEFDINDLRNIYKNDGVYDVSVENALQDLIKKTKMKYKPIFD